ncbi:MAG: hypothetical protein AAB691_00615 [Patescibacteria group bacterium]
MVQRRIWRGSLSSFFLIGLGFTLGALPASRSRVVDASSVALSYGVKTVVEWVDNDVIFSTEHWDIVLHERQYYLGRATMRLKRLCLDLSCVTEEEWLDARFAFNLFDQAAEKAFGAEKVNIGFLTNNGLDIASVIPPISFVHFHLRPRYRHPVWMAGRMFTDKRFGKNFWRNVSEDVPLSFADRQEIIAALRAQLPFEVANSR